MANTLLIAPSRLFLGIAAFCACGLVSVAQVALPPQLRLNATERKTVDVTGTLNIAEGDQVSLELAFTPSTIRPISAEGSSIDLFRCKDVYLRNLVLTDNRVGTFALTCDTAGPVTDGTICRLTLGGVTGGDSVGELRVTGIVINGRPTLVDPPAIMRITVDGVGTAIPNASEGVTSNYPNPFQEETRIEYVVNTPGMVALEIRDLAGRLYYTFPSIYREPGTYTVDYRPKIWEMSSGHYLVRMVTERGTYHHTITVEK